MKLPLDPSGFEDVGRERPQPHDQTLEIISPGVDGPHDVTHRIHQASGRFGDLGQPLSGFVLLFPDLLLDDLAEDHHPGKIQPDVVMKVRRNARPHRLDSQQAPNLEAMQRVNCRPDGECSHGEKPPAQPEGRENGKSDSSG